MAADRKGTMTRDEGGEREADEADEIQLFPRDGEVE